MVNGLIFYNRALVDYPFLTAAVMADQRMLNTEVTWNVFRSFFFFFFKRLILNKYSVCEQEVVACHGWEGPGYTTFLQLFAYLSCRTEC